MNGIRVAAAIAAALVITACSHASRPKPLPGQEAHVANLLQGCPYGLERFLPGDYYFCEAGSNYWAGRYGMARDALESAARWGSKPAQQTLGIMYFNGDHVAANRPLGVAWLALSAERHGPEYESRFVSAYRELSASERTQADAYWNQMKPVYADSVAAVRADHRFNREFWKLQAALQFGGTAYINGLTPGTENGLSLAKRIKNERDTFFAGWDTQVWVGDMELVPLGQLPAVTKPATPPAPPAPESN
ncbi:hypothetical protein [Luteibacter aegosomatissinici]|uniref:hypothetical protein n=1 Tax=Luteibacter aegosomatissinici TaxID=2911539 RepID=UPI001FF8C993|nr:hypothetical protein [Luteibacter aegosomatissinici]UPG93922.1 hypothetical protein L2Y97_19115 [Luteibacter aegosomatissinici]